MVNIDDLEWGDCDELLEDILKNPKVQLPQLIKLSEKLVSIDSKECLEKGTVVVIHEKKTIAKLKGTDANGTEIRLPVDCPFSVRMRLSPGKEKEFESIEVLAKTDPLPKFVEVTKVEGLESVSVGDRLKVVIAEKTGGKPCFVHFRSSAGKHIKIAVDQAISFKLAVNDASEQLLSKIAEKSRELPVAAEFVKNDNTPKSHINLGVFTITKGFTEHVVIGSAKKSNDEYPVAFPLNSSIKFQVNSKLKLAKDEEYRELCEKSSFVDTTEIIEYLNIVNPADSETRYVVKYKTLSKLIGSHDSDSDESEKGSREQLSEASENEVSTLEAEECPLTIHQEQREIVRREKKEKERLAKLEKEKAKAVRKREKKEKKEKEKEEKKKKKMSVASDKSVSEPVSEDLYILPQSPTSPTSPAGNDDDSAYSQWASQIRGKMKNVKDKTKSLGFRQKKRPKLRKEDIVFSSTDAGLNDDPSRDSIYTGLSSENYDSDCLYETLPGEAYESLDLIRQAQRSLAPKSTENSGDSGFDEVDQVKINAWRESMQPPPLPGNHPKQRAEAASCGSEDLYEVAVDSTAAGNNPNSAWKSFYDIVQNSTREIATWGTEDVANCLQDLQLGKYKNVFDESQVDGQLLLDLDESVLIDLGLSLFEARKLRKFVFGWRPDAMRPSTYPELKGFDSKDPSDWNEKDVVSHLLTIDIKDFSDFCSKNQINGELLKDLCVDETIMNSIITSRDRKLKSVKIKNYVIDQWRPKKKGEGNYTSFTPVKKPAHETATAKTESKGSPLNAVRATKSMSSNGKHSPSQNMHRTNSSPANSDTKNAKADTSAPLGVTKKVGGDAPLIARMKQQLEDNKNNWQKK